MTLSGRFFFLLGGRHGRGGAGTFRGGGDDGLLLRLVLAELELLVVEAALLQQAGHGLAGRGADVEPVLAAVELGDELLAFVLVARVVVPELFNHAPVTGRTRIDRAEAVERPVRATQSFQTQLDGHSRSPMSLKLKRIGEYINGDAVYKSARGKAQRPRGGPCKLYVGSPPPCSPS